MNRTEKEEEKITSIEGEFLILFNRLNEKSPLEVVKINIEACEFIIDYLTILYEFILSSNNFGESVRQFRDKIKVNLVKMHHNKCIACLCFLEREQIEGMLSMVLDKRVLDKKGRKTFCDIVKFHSNKSYFENIRARCSEMVFPEKPLIILYSKYDYVRTFIDRYFGNCFYILTCKQTLETIKRQLSFYKSFAGELIKLETIEMNLGFEMGKKKFDGLTEKENKIPADIKLLHSFEAQKKNLWVKYNYKYQR